MARDKEDGGEKRNTVDVMSPLYLFQSENPGAPLRSVVPIRNTVKELWDELQERYGFGNAPKMYQLKAKIQGLRQNGMTVVSYYSKLTALWEELANLTRLQHVLQAIVSHLEFMDVPIEQDELNQKFLTSLAPEWLVYTIVWINRDDLDTMSLDDVYNHLKVYELEVQKRAGSNS
nr:retrovirus-related Pol polyprotein from transposon TNT 1-94 [Tanacetum cinerariifolium]